MEGRSLSHGVLGGQERSNLLMCFAVDDVDAAVERVWAAGGRVEEPTGFAVQALLAPLLVITLLRRVTSSEIAVPDARTVVQRFLKGRLTERQTIA